MRYTDLHNCRRPLASFIISASLKESMREAARKVGTLDKPFEEMLQLTTAEAMLRHFKDYKDTALKKEDKTPEERNNLHTMATALIHAAGELNAVEILSELGRFRVNKGARPSL